MSVSIGNGTPLFWLHEINKLDKHRLLVPIWGNMVSHTITRTKRSEMDEVIRTAFGNQAGKIAFAANAITPGPLKDGSKLGTFPISEVDDDMTFGFHIAFGEPEWVRGKEVLTSLAAMHKRVGEIMIRFDNEGAALTRPPFLCLLHGGRLTNFDLLKDPRRKPDLAGLGVMAAYFDCR